MGAGHTQMALLAPLIAPHHLCRFTHAHRIDWPIDAASAGAGDDFGPPKCRAEEDFKEAKMARRSLSISTFADGLLLPLLHLNAGAMPFIWRRIT